MAASTVSLEEQGRRWAIDSPIVPPLVTLLVMFVLFSFVVPNFGTMRTVSGIVNAASVNAVMIVGVTLLMISGEFDLSVGSIMLMGGHVFAMMVLYKGSGPFVAIVLALLATAFMGLLNGLIRVWTGIPSFIVTLGTRSVYRMVAWAFTGGLLMQTRERMPVFDLLNGPLDLVNGLFFRASFRTVTLWAIILGVIVQIVLTRSSFGNHCFASGANSGAAATQGVNVKVVKLMCFTLSGTLAGLGGVFLFCGFGSILMSQGINVELTAIASAVVGGTALIGGEGSIVGALLGVLLINTLRTGVVLLGLPPDNFMSIVGLTIVAASALQVWIRRRPLG